MNITPVVLRGKETDFGSGTQGCRQASTAVSFSTVQPHFNLGLTGSCVNPANTFKQKQRGERQEHAGTSSRHHLPTDGYNLGALGQKELGEIFDEKICPFRKRGAFGLAQQVMCKITVEQKDRYGDGTFVIDLIQWGALVPVLWHQWYLLEALCLLRARVTGRNKYLLWLFFPEPRLKKTAFMRKCNIFGHYQG